MTKPNKADAERPACVQTVRADGGGGQDCGGGNVVSRPEKLLLRVLREASGAREPWVYAVTREKPGSYTEQDNP